MTSDSPNTDPGYLRSYGRRRGKKQRPGRERLMDDLLPRLQVKSGTPIPDQFPPGTKALWLEIGFGGGEHLSQQAKAHPDIGFIGCEPFLNGVGKLLSQLDNDGSENVRIHADDARDIFPDFPDGSLARVFVLFPDPWPKTKHHKRRLIQTPFLDDLARMLEDGGEFRLASDHMGYVRWALAHVSRHPDFEWMAEGPEDWREPPEDWIGTRYEQKRLAGDTIVYLRFRRKPRTG
ncbi:tRNA (guanosine(46)-N7)-methyltransferase TrmB [Magnetovibrio blakemorei]|uniref:tRNA (guanine-N(7)-)-methyltransferase n=1 Tax=Magnetovibrio blakemorei TaxID=28181 RepID=A0A1E5Q3P6_9PROT|nr:tRNA (guanosine(46)-N7)-methyltransferase TrmB [Magnetovibrio blakemorei]OEJ64316.1 tRNA (guanosine(46)-N7)-methyltransferase TrmB [Magnetovibrio blakemorei]